MSEKLFVGSYYSPYDFPLPEILTGHINRNKEAFSFMDYPEIHVCILKQASVKAAIISIDLLEMDSNLCMDFRKQVGSVLGISADRVMISCTHCHTVPAAIKLGLVDISERFVESMRQALLNAVRKADSSYLECNVFSSVGDCKGIGINRRKLIDGQIVMAPNPDIPIDSSVVCYWFFPVDSDKPLCCFVNHALHATTLDTSIFQVSADYPGRMRRRIIDRLGSINVLFFNGTCGDVRPALIHEDGGFRGGFEEDLDDIGNRLGDSVLESLEKMKSEKMKSEKPDLRVESNALSLRYDYVARANAKRRVLSESSSEARQINQDLMSAAFAAWDVYIREEEKEDLPESVPFICQCISISPNAKVLGLEGEMFTETGLKIKQETGNRIIIAAYSNGSVGYVPTEEALAAGGYEAEDAYKIYWKNAPFTKDTSYYITEESINLIKQTDITG